MNYFRDLGVYLWAKPLARTVCPWRVAVVLLWLCTPTFDSAFGKAFGGGWWWVVAGLIVAPRSLLAVAMAMLVEGRVAGGWTLVLFVAAMADLARLMPQYDRLTVGQIIARVFRGGPMPDERGLAHVADRA